MVAFSVVSAGTHAWTGRPMHPLAAEVLSEYGIGEDGFRSRRLTEGLVRKADLILTASREQRSACVAFDPTAVRRAFTIPQFGRYAAGLSPYALTAVWPPQERVRALIEQISIVRGELPVVPPEEDDLPDPVRLPIEAFRRCAAEIQAVVDTMVGLIAPIQPAPPVPRPWAAARRLT